MIPLMMEEGYRPTGWLGLLLGAKLYINFHPAAVETEELFMSSMALVERELDDRGKIGHDVSLSEGEPPKVAAFEPAPEPTPAPTPAPAPAPAPVAPAATGTPTTPARTTLVPAANEVERFPSGFQMSPMQQQRQQQASSTSVSSIASGSFAEMVAFFRDERQHLEAKVESQRQEMEVQRQAWQTKLEQHQREIEAQRQEIEQLKNQSIQARLREHQTAALQARFNALHASKLLTDDELYKLEDALIESLDGCDAGQLATSLIALSERVANESAFARHLRRKYAEQPGV
eukprot:COSAG02_NODE_703_length_18313_cov_58.533652_5_plen_289_part_00